MFATHSSSMLTFPFEQYRLFHCFLIFCIQIIMSDKGLSISDSLMSPMNYVTKTYLTVFPKIKRCKKICISIKFYL